MIKVKICAKPITCTGKFAEAFFSVKKNYAPCVLTYNQVKKIINKYIELLGKPIYPSIHNCSEMQKEYWILEQLIYWYKWSSSSDTLTFK